MSIGLDGSRAFNQQRTGVEEYAYQTIRQLARLWADREVVLYLKRKQEWKIDFPLPKKWRIKFIPFSNFWTQMGLSWEILSNSPETLFCPAHVVPIIHPRSIMTVHGLEYEHSPEAYSLYSRLLHRFLVKRGCRWADKIIAVSEKTKQDLIELYQIDPRKIEVIHNGVSFFESRERLIFPEEKGGHLFFVGRIEQRKNVGTVIKVFEILKQKYAYSGSLILAGKPGFGYEKIKKQIENSTFQKEIIEKGFVEEDEKWRLLSSADAVIYPSFSEGFGLPILEAQKAGVPIVASNIPSSREVAGGKDFLFPPEDAEKMAAWVVKVIKNKIFREKVIAAGRKNAEKYSWEKCAQKTAEIMNLF